nr:hypothetical protein [Tanacetum cinerariifolium]
MTYSEILDMLVCKLECEIRALFYSIPKNSLETGLTIVECDNDVKKMYDTAEFYEDVYGGGCFDVSGSFKGFDCIEEPVGCDDGSLSVKIKDEFKNEVILDDVVSSPANLLMLLKRKDDQGNVFRGKPGRTSVYSKGNKHLVSKKGSCLKKGSCSKGVVRGKHVESDVDSVEVMILESDYDSPHSMNSNDTWEPRKNVTKIPQIIFNLFIYITTDCTMTQTTSMKIDSNADVALTDTKQKVTGIKDVEDLQEEPPKPHYGPIKTEVEEPLRLDIMYPHSHVASSVMGT